MKFLNKFRTLRTIHIFYFVISVMISAILSWGFYSLGTTLINNRYLNYDSIELRRKEYEDSFEKYVKQNSLETSDFTSLSSWIKKNPYVYVFIVDDNGVVVYESGEWSSRSANYYFYLEDEPEEHAINSNSNEEEILYELERNIQFEDGLYTVYITESTVNYWYNILNFSTMGVGILSLMLLQVLFTNRIIKKIELLSEEVSRIEKGDINSPITQKGNNEFTRLAYHVDTMRDSLIHQMRREHKLVNTNYELVSALSHDVRTPLTSLIGYMEILNDSDEFTTEQQREYLRRSKNKTLQLKSISDKMFQYFFDFNENYLDTNFEDYDVTVLIQQLVYERVFDLQNSGFEVQVDLEETHHIITADIHYLQRLFDNVFSNISKYGEKDNVEIEGLVEEGFYTITFKNKKLENMEKNKSTHIGLKTCEKIMNQLEGAFIVEQNPSEFMVTIRIPTKEKQ